MDILQYLVALLKDNKHIGVEGLGTFIKHKKPGRYDAATHSFLPPTYVLNFTTDVLENSNLVNYIQNKRGVSEDTAKYFVSQFVEQFQKDVNEAEQKVEDLGTFSLVNGQLTFKADDNVNTGFDFFALPPVNAENIEQAAETFITDEHVEQVKAPDFEQEIARVAHNEQKVVVDQEPIDAERVEDDATLNKVFEEITDVHVSNPTNQAPVVDEVEEQSVPVQQIIAEKIQANEYQGTQEEIEEERKSSGAFWKISITLLVLLAIAATVYFLKPDWFNAQQQPSTTDTLTSTLKRDGLVTQADSLDFADSVMAEAHKVGLDVKPAKDTLKVTTTTKPLPPVTYDIIGAAFAKLSEADEYITIMKAKGFDAKIAKMPGKIYKKISIASYDNIDSAQKYISIYKQQLNNPKIYIQTIKNN